MFSDCEFNSTVDALESYGAESKTKKSRRKSKAKRIMSIELCLWILEWILTQAPNARERLLNNSELTGRITKTLGSFFETLRDPTILECLLKICTHRKTLEGGDADAVARSVFPQELIDFMNPAKILDSNSGANKKRTRRNDSEEAQRVHVVLCFIDTCFALR